MSEEMEFPNTFEEFINEYSFVDKNEVYTNGSELTQKFRVMQGYEHFVKQIRADAIDEALMLCTYSNQPNNEEYDKGFDDGVALVRRRLRQMQKGTENDNNGVN